MNSKSWVVPGDGFRHSFQRRLEVRVPRVEIEPLLEDAMRRQLRELGDDRAVMRVVGADEDAVPLPPAGLRRLDEDHHLAAEQVDGQPAEHPLGEEARMVLEGLHDPFVVEGLHRSHDVSARSAARAP